jgi:hypothetical protein
MITNHLKRIIIIIIIFILITTCFPSPFPAQSIPKQTYLHSYAETDQSNHITNLTVSQQVQLSQFTEELHNEIKKSKSPKESKKIIAEKLRQLNQHNIITQDQYNLLFNLLQLIPTPQVYSQIPDNQNTSNRFCFLIGETSTTRHLNIAEFIFTRNLYRLFIIYFIAQFIFSGETIITIISNLRNLHNNYQELRPELLPTAGAISLGLRQRSGSPPNQLKTYPAIGEITAIGTKGKTYTNGSYIGTIRSLKSPIYQYCTYFLGISGFIGISITLNNQNNWFIGAAVSLQTEYYPPQPY